MKYNYSRIFCTNFTKKNKKNNKYSRNTFLTSHLDQNNCVAIVFASVQFNQILPNKEFNPLWRPNSASSHLILFCSVVAASGRSFNAYILC